MSFINPTDPGGSTGTTPSGGSTESWFEALARAWGTALDAQASLITTLSDQIDAAGGTDQPSLTSQLTAESQRLDFLSNSEASSVNAVGDALQAVARKQ
jgi:hypothetical protein